MRPEMVITHELIGLEVELVESKNRCLRGIGGRVVDETRNMIVIEGERGLKKVPKRGNVFVFNFNGQRVNVSGELINFRPEERIKRGLQILRRGRR